MYTRGKERDEDEEKFTQREDEDREVEREGRGLCKGQGICDAEN